MINVILATHSVFSSDTSDTHGPAHSVAEYLTYKKVYYTFIKHPIFGSYKSRIEKSDGGVDHVGGMLHSVVLRPLFELIINLRVCYVSRSPKLIFIGVDPLNALSGVIAKYLGWVSQVVFYTPDYTNRRFQNSTVNTLYHAIDVFAARHADQVWCVSQKIVTVRKEQGVSTDRLYFVPNSPSLRLIGKMSDHKRPDKLVMVGNVIPTVDYSFIIGAIEKLHNTYPMLTLSIVGTGEYAKALQDDVHKRNLTRSIHFLGTLSHENIIRLLKKSGIGIALYTGKYETNYFGDSMKIREYLACGLPVMTTDVVETANIVREFHAGEIITIQESSFLGAVRKLLDKRRYATYHKNALRAAESYDFDARVSIPLRRIILDM